VGGAENSGIILTQYRGKEEIRLEKKGSGGHQKPV
jgi:hypothetical protein